MKQSRLNSAITEEADDDGVGLERERVANCDRKRPTHDAGRHDRSLMHQMHRAAPTSAEPALTPSELG